MKAFFLSISLMACALASESLEKLLLEHNYNLKALSLEVEALKKEVDLSDNWQNPTLKLGFNDILLDEPLTRDKEAMQTDSLTFSQKIYTASKTDIKRKLSQKNLYLKEQVLQDTKQKLLTQVRSLVLELSKVDADLVLLKEYEEVLKELDELHQAYSSAKSMHYVASLQTGLSKESLKLRKNRLLNQQKLIKARLESLVNQPITVLPSKALKAFFFQENKLKERLLEQNVRLSMQALLVEKQQQNLHLERAKKVPDITLSLGYARREAFDDYATFALSIPLPLYESENLAIAKAVKLKRAEQERKQMLAEQLWFEVQQALLQKHLASKQLMVQDALIEQESQIYENYKVLLQSQANTFEKLYKSLVSILESKFAKNALVFEHNKAVLRLRYLLGEVE